MSGYRMTFEEIDGENDFQKVEVGVGAECLACEEGDELSHTLSIMFGQMIAMVGGDEATRAFASALAYNDDCRTDCFGEVVSAVNSFFDAATQVSIAYGLRDENFRRRQEELRKKE